MKCHEKIRFRSFADAARARLEHESRLLADKGELVTYQCDRCRGYHNGHIQRSRKADAAIEQQLQPKKDWPLVDRLPIEQRESLLRQVRR